MGIISNGTTVLDNGSITDNIIDTAQIVDAAVEDAKTNTITSSKLTGALPALDGSNLTGISVSPFSAKSLGTSNFVNGYVKYTNGYTIQWGKNATPGTDSELSISFPTAFTNIFSIVIRGADNADFRLNDGGNITSDTSTSTSGFSIRVGAAAENMYWHATGYIS